MRVLLLNPPGSENYIRDYFCSKLSKAEYKSAPTTLLMLSGIVGEKHQVSVLDALAENLNVPQTLRVCRAFAPEVAIVLVGAVSWDEDRAFLTQLKKHTRAYVIGIGDVLLADAALRLQQAPALDAALLNFATADVLRLIPPPQGRKVNYAVYRHPVSGRLVAGEHKPVRGNYRVPCPRHELFPLKKYRFPFALQAPMSVVLTDYGCPFHCGFCVMPSLGFALRPLEDVLVELRQLKRLGVRELFFIDQTFGVQAKRTLALCAALAQPDLKFSWCCFSRADVTTPEILTAMARAGCHTIIYGVESGSESVRKRLGKQMSLELLYGVFAACRRLGVRVGATFLLGLPGETESQVRQTIQLALDLPLDFASFNVAIPRAQTCLRAETLSAGVLPEALVGLDQSGKKGALGTQELSGDRILALRQEALRRFYLRPAYLRHRLWELRSWVDARSQFRDGWSIVRDALGKAGRKA